MRELKEILEDVHVVEQHGTTDVIVKDVQIDSRRVSKSSCFVAVKGLVTDGHNYIDKAIQKGASVIVCEILPSQLKPEITYLRVESSARASAIMSHNFFGRVSYKMKLVGVTGTNGKTTVATLLFKLFQSMGDYCGLISTVQNQIGDTVLPSDRTTPDPITLNELIHEMYEKGCSYVFMEVSSHAIHQHRVDGLHFAGGIFTNITHDHLDYHKTFEEYLRVKKSFFDSLPSTAFAITNGDDRRGLVMLQNTKAKKFVYSMKAMADFKGKMLDDALTGLEMTVNGIDVHFQLIGTFNASNLLAVFGAAVCLGRDKNEVLQKLSSLKGAEGRFDYSVSEEKKIIGIIDYAHTPDALMNVLATIKNLRPDGKKIVTVVGCGGDRDRTKRPEMAAVACEYSDKVVFTSDNPRSEDPDEIIREMEAGVPVTARKKYVSVTSREEAIKLGVSLCDQGDILLIAGKGHEKYQEMKGVKHHFDDKEVLAEMFKLFND